VDGGEGLTEWPDARVPAYGMASGDVPLTRQDGAPGKGYADMAKPEPKTDEGKAVLPALKDLMPVERIALDVEAPDWRGAIRVSGQLLVDARIAEPRYVEAMIRIAEELGPYIVIAPHIALPHARRWCVGNWAQFGEIEDTS
jgi:hypothetical protein